MNQTAQFLFALGAILLLGLAADFLGRRTFLPRVTLLLLVGILVGDQVLASWDPPSQSWRRLEPRATVRTGQRFYALPAFHPQIAFQSGVQLMMCGPAHFRLLEPIKGEDTIAVAFGRAYFDSVGDRGASVRLKTPSVQGRLTLPHLEAAAAVECWQHVPLGLSLIHISEPTRPVGISRMPSSA